MWTAMLFAVASVYLMSCVIEASPIIRTADHNHITTYSVIYGLISAYLTVYAIMKLSKTPDIMALWVVSCHTGAVFFALLGQIPWLENLALTPGWLHRLSPPAIVVVVIFTLIILATGIRQARETCRLRDWNIKVHAYVVLAALYFIVFIMVVTKGASYHFHVHHAIASVALSIFYTNWSSKIDITMHGILIGIAIEGIAFFGTSEAMLFMIQNAPMKEGTIVISWACVAVLGILWAHISARKQIRVHSIPLEM